MPRQVEVPFTSRLAYENITARGLLPPARYRVYDLLYRNGPLTARECDDAINRDAHKRLTELLEHGVIEQVNTTTCPVTGQTVVLWDITDRLPSPLRRPQSQVLTGRAKAIDEIRRRFPENRRSPELCALLAELEADPPEPAPEPDDDALEAMFGG